MTSGARKLAVVGASLAGLRAAEELRRRGHDGPLVMVGAEPHLPYDRPPLSKELLVGDWEAEQTVLRRQGYGDLDLDWRLGTRAVSLDAPGRVVELDDGDRVDFDGLVVATGSIPRALPDQPDHEGIFMLRTLDDALALRAALERSPRVVVVGAGFIGAEVAAACRRRHLDVTVLEALPSPMVRGLGPRLGDALGALHRDHGVELRVNAGVAGFDADGAGHVARVRLADGGAVDADVVVVGVGVVPATDWLAGSGLTVDNGVVCDETCLAAPGIVAAGDVARWPNPVFDGELMRLEHWTNAAEQGVVAAKRLLATDEEAVPFAPVPFVWSDQYDVKIQVAGHVRGDDEMEIVDGSIEDRKFVAIFGRAGRLVGAVAFSRPRLLMQYRRMVQERVSFADALASARATS
jgi:3-phenylpropionate/trans-cinnamate dioxygenase ferredoxin reductase component